VANRAPVAMGARKRMQTNRHPLAIAPFIHSHRPSHSPAEPHPDRLLCVPCLT
jgi:hypothetical protein